MRKAIRIICAATGAIIISALLFGFSSKNAGEFSSGVISIGVVVSDLEKSIDFYTGVVGMTETGGFSVDGEFGKKSGLTDGLPFDVTILKLQDSDQATEWKLMSFKREKSGKRSESIEEDTGVQYITIFVTSMKPFMERIENNKVRILSEIPAVLEDGRHFVLIQDPDGTFIELIGPE